MQERLSWRPATGALVAAAIAGILLLGCSGPAAAQETAAVETGAGATVFVLPLHGPIDKSLMMLFRRAFRDVERLRPDAIVIDINTPGGGLLETKEIIAWMRSVDVPIYAFVNTEALSAGAIVSLGTPEIFMAEGSQIGSAMPILVSPGGEVKELPDDYQEKILSSVRSLVRTLAQENGHSEELAMAMVDRSYEVRIGDRVINVKGELLNLTAREAVEVVPPATKPVLASAIVADLDALLEYKGLAGATVVTFEAEPAERLARWIVMIGPLLFALGVLGVFIELKTPGLGIPGIGGVCLLIVFFFGHFVAGLAGIEDVVLVMLGFILLAVEIFVIPGFGVTGVAGIVLILAGTAMATVPHLPQAPPIPAGAAPQLVEYLQGALLRLLIMMGLSGVGLWILSKLLPHTSIYHRIILERELTRSAGFVSGDEELKRYLGREGVAATPLRPAGIAMFGDERLDVVTTGDLIQRDATVRIVQIQGNRIVVEPMDEGPLAPK